VLGLRGRARAQDDGGVDVKLLFDQNLSPKLVGRLADIFPGSSHVFNLGLDRSDDLLIWEYARDQGFAIVTKDADFGDLGILRGHPPKILWLLIGNCTTAQVATLLRDRHDVIEEFEADPTRSTLCL
jgi:predicted nuclease of predicted toxin-antitoxin system